MTKEKLDFKCPNCKKKNRIKLFKECTEEQIISIVDRSIFTFECIECHEKIIIDYPLKLIGKNYLIYYTPGIDNEIDAETYEYMRICDTYDNFKEKVLIFEDDLNDIVIEFIKEFLINQLPKDLKDQVTIIRYDGCDEENLIFYLRGLNKSIGCTKIFYKEILAKSKIKKISKCINIDSNTYSKYFKLR